MSRQDQAAADHAFCAEVLPRVSRTFALSIEALPDSLREAVRISYLLCRIVDTVEDGVGIAPTDRMALFGMFDELMADSSVQPGLFEDRATVCMERVESAERELCSGAGAVFRCFRALSRQQQDTIRPAVQEMSGGMQEYVQRAGAAGITLSTMPDLERYCYFVAGTVGKLLTALFFQQVPRLPPGARQSIESRAVSFGLGLQMVNIVKDVAADHERGGHCFVPGRVVEQAGVEPDRLLTPEGREAALGALRLVCGRARDHLRQAEEYTRLWPVPEGNAVREFCAVPLALALATLREVERGDDTLREGRTPKVSRQTVARVVTEARRAVGSNEALDRLFDGYRPSV